MPGFQRMAMEVPWKSMEFFAVAPHMVRSENSHRLEGKY